MLLKCRFLSKFTASEMAKFRYLDSDTVVKAIEMCPYMSQSMRGLTTTSNTVSNKPNQESQSMLKFFISFFFNLKVNKHFSSSIKVKSTSHEANNAVCTNTINCPFFNRGNIELSNLVKKKNMDDLNESGQENVFEKTEKQSK